MTRILVVANQKGGVGKTTTMLNLGALLARQGRVLLVDLDPQANLTAGCGFDPYRVERSSYSILLYDGITLSRVLRPVRPNLALVPGSVDLAAAAFKLVQEAHPLDRLRGALRESRVNFDFILIDTPPGLNVLMVAGMLAADEVLIPAQCNHMAILGIRAVQDVVRQVRDKMDNPALHLAGVLPTFYDLNIASAPAVLDEMRALLPEQLLNTVVPYDPQIADAAFKGKAIVDFAPESPGALAYHQLAEEWLGQTAS